MKKGSSFYRSCFEEPAFDWKRLHSWYLYTLHICVSLPNFEKVSDLNKILHDDDDRIIRKLVHLNVSYLLTYSMVQSPS